MPKVPLELKRSADTLYADATSGSMQLLPLHWSSNLYLIRAPNGIGYCCEDPAAPSDGTVRVAQSCSFLSELGQLWAVDKRMLAAYPNQVHFALLQEELTHGISQYLSMLARMGVKYPIKWVANVSGIAGFRMELPVALNMMPGGGHEFISDIVECEGWIKDKAQVPGTLRPFFEELYHACGLTMPPAPKQSKE